LEDKKIHFLREQIRQKIYNYYAQDMKKQLYNPENFITLEFILEKLKHCNLDCFYCREPVFLWYEIAREPKQWTVERIDNKIGHDIGNIEIACLSCNLKRRCMYHERYVFTKQMKIVKGC
jgi:sulfatase maturation enzyme AslB (radical SAM superfamily)